MSFAIVSVDGPSYSSRSHTTGVEYEFTYHVGFTGAYDPVALMYTTDARLPKRGSYLTTTFAPTGDANVYCSAVDIDLDNESVGTGTSDVPGYAVYKVHWSQITSDRLDLQPTSRPAIIEGEGGDDRFVSLYDKDGHAIVNSAGDFYENIPEQPIMGVSFTIRRNESSNPANNAATYSNSVNSASWNGVGAGFGLMGKIRYRPCTESFNAYQFNFWEVEYPIKLRVDGWRWKPLDNGYRVLGGTSGTTAVKWVDETGQEPSQPILLNGSGAKAADGSTGVYFPTAGYKILQETSWGSLSLPNPF